MCSKYGAPSSSAIASFGGAKKFTTITTDGAAPSLATVDWVQIDWQSSFHGMGIQTTDGKPKWFFTATVTESFGSSNPQMTISNTSPTNLDGTYYVKGSPSTFLLVAPMQPKLPHKTH